MKRWSFYLLLLGLVGCNESIQEETTNAPKTNALISSEKPLQLTLQQAEELAELPLKCIDQEYPNKLNQVISGTQDLAAPTSLHPAFYGCFDWHSAVHGHWSLVRLVRLFPEIKQRDQIIAGLQQHLTSEKIQGELKYFEHPQSNSFERMYGWAWLFKLAEELHRWDDPVARELEKNLQPLTDLIAEKTIEFLPKLNYPIRVGTHTNTAFALCMVHDFATEFDRTELKELVENRAKEYFATDQNCPLSWEPSGYDFLSPCLEEADLMRRVLAPEDFQKWIEQFLPQLTQPDFQLAPGIVSDREDGHLVHLDGLNYSRAWCLKGMAKTAPELGHLNAMANAHIEHSLSDLTDGNYEGGHWLVSFALMTLTD